MTPLEEVLAGRDERAAWQRLWLEATEGSYFICQIGLNIPGYPKRIPRDIEIVRKCRKYLMDHAMPFRPKNGILRTAQASAGRGPSTP